MDILIKIKDIIIHFLRRILRITLSFVCWIVCTLIYIVTFEPNTKHKATVRKVKRIRVLTKFKLYLYNWFKPVFKFLHYDYYERLDNKFHFLIEK